jgi:hypothetical protein
MAAGAWVVYDSVAEKMGDGTMDMDAIECDMILCLSTSNCATTTLALYSEITNEVATDFGYTQSGEVCTGTISAANQWLRSAGTVKFDCDDVVWTAAGGSIVARFAVIKEHTTGHLIACCLLDSSPADVTATTGNTLTVTIHGDGVFSVARAA